MTYNVFGGTLSLAQSITLHSLWHCAVVFIVCGTVLLCSLHELLFHSVVVIVFCAVSASLVP